jgi:hypothetical protein
MSTSLVKPSAVIRHLLSGLRGNRPRRTQDLGYFTGHRLKDERVGLRPRHARWAVNAAQTLVQRHA